jgi:dextranase
MTTPTDPPAASQPGAAASTELLPCAGIYRSGQSVQIEIRNLTAPGQLNIWHLGDLVQRIDVTDDGIVDLGALPPGGYLIGLGEARTAIDVTENPRSVLRYGFVADYRPGRDIAAVSDNLRRLHLTGIQFYDWAYRHADLLGGGEQYDDALDQPISLATVRDLIDACHRAGADALGYAAVYAVGNREWKTWQHDALLAASGQAHALGDFLRLVDPAAEDWLAHFTGDLAAATTRIGFDGFHLDQYGYPKHAHRPDGRGVDLADSFTRLIDAVRDALPAARLVFNNVNDFPTWATAQAPQDAVYIEVWEPHTGFEHLAQTVTRARSVAGGKPVVVAAYQHVYDTSDVAEADWAASFTMATLFSHGATHLFAGEADRVLTDPYYVRNHHIAPSTAAMLRRYYDFAVAYSELLFDPGIVEVTSSLVSDYNGDLDVVCEGCDVDQIARAGIMWRRVTRLPDGRYVMHLINLSGQDDTAWDAPRRPPADPGAATLTIRRCGIDMPRVRIASPDTDHRLREITLAVDSDRAIGTLPAPAIWQLLLIDVSSPAAE